jgi:hypothetical protein
VLLQRRDVDFDFETSEAPQTIFAADGWNTLATIDCN